MSAAVIGFLSSHDASCSVVSKFGINEVHLSIYLSTLNQKQGCEQPRFLSSHETNAAWERESGFFPLQPLLPVKPPPSKCR